MSKDEQTNVTLIEPGVIQGSQHLRAFVGQANWDRYWTKLFVGLAGEGLKALAKGRSQDQLLQVSGSSPAHGKIVTTIGTMLATREHRQRDFANMTFFLLYRDFEHFVASLCLHGYEQLGRDAPFNECKKLMVTSTWASKLGKIREHFALGDRFGGRAFREFWRQNSINIHGSRGVEDLLDFLAQVRHTVVHGPSIAYEGLEDYGLSAGKRVQAPSEAIEPIYCWLVALAKFFDRAFVRHFGWKTEEFDEASELVEIMQSPSSADPNQEATEEKSGP